MLRSSHGPLPASMFVSSRTFEQKQQIGTKHSRCLPLSLGPYARCMTYTFRLSIIRRYANRLARPGESLASCANTILNDHLVDDLTTGDTAPSTHTVMPAPARPNEKIHRVHETMASMTTHPIIHPAADAVQPVDRGLDERHTFLQTNWH